MNTTGQNGTALGETTAKQRKLIAAILVAPDIQAACRASKIGRTTAHRWLREDPRFCDELARRQDEVFGAALRAIKGHAVKAVDELARLLTSKDSRLRRLTANDILNQAIKAKELVEHEARLAALEAAMREKGIL